MHKTDLYLFGALWESAKANWVMTVRQSPDSDLTVEQTFSRDSYLKMSRVVWWRFWGWFDSSTTCTNRWRHIDFLGEIWIRLFFDSWWSFKRRHVDFCLRLTNSFSFDSVSIVSEVFEIGFSSPFSLSSPVEETRIFRLRTGFDFWTRCSDLDTMSGTLVSLSGTSFSDSKFGFLFFSTLVNLLLLAIFFRLNTTLSNLLPWVEVWWVGPEETNKIHYQLKFWCFVTWILL